MNFDTLNNCSEMDRKTIEKMYHDLGGDKSENTQIYETIIESKHQNAAMVNVGQSLYRDIKGWCVNYITSKLEKDYGYDVYERSKVIEKINDNVLAPRQRLSLVHYVKYILSQYNDDGAWLDSLTKELKLAILKKECLLKFLIVWSSSKKWHCLVTIMAFFVVELLVLLPAPVEWMATFDLQQVNYSECGWINYMANVLAIKIDWIDGPQFSCINWRGVLLCALWLLVYVVFIVNILFNNIFSDITEYDEH